MVRLESDDSKHGPPPEDAELFVLEALEEGTWTAEERLVHADMRTAYEEKRRDLLPARDARTGSSLAAQPAPEGLSTKQVVQAAMQHMVRLTKDLFSADNEWLAMIGADLDDVLTRQRRQGRTATAKARYNAVHAELVAVATKARDFIRHADSLEAQGVDGSREALETPELRSGRPAARRSSEEPRSGGGSGSEVDDPAAELTDWSTACDTIWRGDEHDESRRLNITREAYGYIPRQAGWKRDKPRVSAMKALTTADLHLWLWWVACSDIRGVYESPRAHWPTSFPAHLKQLESSKEMVYDDIVGLTRGKLDKITQPVYANIFGRISGAPRQTPLGLIGPRPIEEIGEEWVLVRMWMVNAARQVCKDTRFDDTWSAFKVELERRRDVADKRPATTTATEKAPPPANKKARSHR